MSLTHGNSDRPLSRSSDNQVRGTYFESRDLVIGGAAGPVGGTRVGYGEGRFAAFVSSAVGLGGGRPGAIGRCFGGIG